MPWNVRWRADVRTCPVKIQNESSTACAQRQQELTKGTRSADNALPSIMFVQGRAELAWARSDRAAADGEKSLSDPALSNRHCDFCETRCMLCIGGDW